MTSLAARTDSAVSIYTEEHIELIKQTVCKGASNAELQLFLHTCKRTGLDPLARQIYSLPGKQGRTIQVGIDGFRLIAQRTGEYQGQDPVQWCDLDGVWSDVWLGEGPPSAARCSVYRQGFLRPLVAVARFKSYNAGTPIWSSKPDVMLAKCAESLALRKAFPQELAGVYTDDEMPEEHHEPRAPRAEALAGRLESAVSAPDLAAEIARGIHRAETLEELIAATRNARSLPRQAWEATKAAYEIRRAAIVDSALGADDDEPPTSDDSTIGVMVPSPPLTSLAPGRPTSADRLADKLGG